MQGFNYRNIGDTLPGWCFQLITRYPVHASMRVFDNLSVTGIEHLQQFRGDSPVILAANHTHELDGFLLPAAIPLHSFPEPIHPVTREADFYKDKGIRGEIYAHGLLFYLMGAFPAYAGQRDYQKSLHNQIKLLQDNASILMFPEGKARDRRMKAKAGIGFLSMYTRTPVVPIYSTWLNANEDAKVIIGSPLTPPKSNNESDTIHTANSFSQKILEKIYELR